MKTSDKLKFGIRVKNERHGEWNEEYEYSYKQICEWLEDTELKKGKSF